MSLIPDNHSHPMPPEQTGIIAWFARNAVAANLLLISVIILGILSLYSLRKEVFPSIEPRFITVSVSYYSGNAKQAEEGIAIKIENALETVTGIKRITSVSNANGSTVTIEKETDYSLDSLFTNVKTKVDSIYNLPTDAQKPVIEKAKREDHAIWVQLFGDADRVTLQKLAEKLKTALLAKPAIRNLSISAESQALMSVEVDDSKLQAYGITLSDVENVINAESSAPLTTSLRNDNKIMRLKASEQAYQAGDFAKIPLLTTADGAIITLGDVATITDTFDDDPYTLSRYNQQNGMSIEIVMDEQGDITQIVDQANAVVKEWNERGLLPNNVQLKTWYDGSTIIKDRLSLLTKNAISGIALVFIILALFLNLRLAFWVAAGLPFVFFGTLYFMTDTFTGLTINEMTTFGFIMALGIVVDDAVVISESIYTTRQRYGDTIENTILGTKKVAIPTIFGVLTTVAAFMALANISGNIGKLFSQFATVVTICLLLSLVESKFILPSHLAHLNTQNIATSGIAGVWAKIQSFANGSLQWFNTRLYQPAIHWALDFRYAVVLIFVAIFILVTAMPFMGSVRVSFFPDITGDVISVNMSMQNDASFGQTNTNLLTLEKTAIEADHQLAEKYQTNTPSIKSVQVIASADLSGKLIVEMDSASPYSSTELIKQWQQLVGSPEGVKKIKFSSKKEMVDNFKVELKSNNEATLTAAGAQFKTALLNTKGVNGIDDNLSPGQAQLHFTLSNQGRSLGMDTSTLSEQLLQAFGGQVVQRYQRDKDEVWVRVRYPKLQRQTLADIMQARVRTPDGTIVPLSAVANINTEYQQDEVTRINNQSAIFLSAGVDKTIIAPNELVANLKRNLVPQLQNQYPDLNIYFAGEAEQQQETASSMSSMFVLAMLAIYVLLAIPLKSYIQPVLIMMAIPFGIVGAILGHWINDITISLLSLNGILALSGVVVNDSLLLVSRFNELIKEGKLSVHQAIVTACTSRLRAILLTSVTTFAGLVPLLSETSLQAQFLIPAAASLAYGILFATGITLILIPALLLIQCEIKAFLGTLSNKLISSKTQKAVSSC
ncbi:efflux RND transporter permease subunit [Shewanella surugensis]|uniref:Efflux RND transporter permease subunit n=1 Tax=Shewanella surugensis TaxID=212020 RepID=A0ABT0LG64_9GAMM|nr:efflux RND transporter permease subunit [Shewanella surugensis]MCL1126564.1 efflux RND transporter permease subunit [Shewanella surugensis]